MPKIHRDRRSIRLPDYDYTSPGAYLVTICTQNRKCLFGEIVELTMVLNDIGRVVAEAWKWLEKQYPYVELDKFIIMPNHLHGIVFIFDDCRGGSRTAPTKKRKPLGRLIGAFKTVLTKRIKKTGRNIKGQLWQRGFYEHIVRKYENFNRTREYIVNNPARWAFDRENPYKKKDRLNKRTIELYLEIRCHKLLYTHPTPGSSGLC